MQRRTIKVLVAAAVAALVGSAGVATAAVVSSPLKSQFTVVNGSIRKATGTPKPASGSQASLWSNSSTATTTITGSGRLLLGAIGDNCDGWPQVRVEVDGKVAGTTTFVSSTLYGTYGVGGEVAAGRHTVKVSFINDHRTSRCDRNVHLGYARMANTPDPVQPTPSGTASPTPSVSPTVAPTTTAPGGFVHPGVLVNKAQIDFVKSQLGAGAQPWTDALAKAKTKSGLAVRTPHLTDLVQKSNMSAKCDPNGGASCVVNCGSRSVPDDGCTDEANDASAAYTQALLWVYTGQESYAQSAVTMLNAWSAVLAGYTGSNAALQASWSAEVFVRAAEIIRYTYTPSAGKPAFNVARFTSMLNNAFLPAINSRSVANTHGNWELGAADGKMSIAVFTDNRKLFDEALSIWRGRTPAYIYLTSDGALPKVAPGMSWTNKSQLTCYWLDSATNCANATTTFQNGQIQESCRDYEHVAFGLASMMNAAETAHIQGVDLFGEQATRIKAGLEHTAHILNTVTSATGYPAGFCKGNSGLEAPTIQPTYEIGYNAMVNRGHGELPETAKLIQRFGSSGGTANNHMMNWETLTHHGVGNR